MKLKIPKLKVNRITAEQRQIDVLEADVQFTTAASKKKSKKIGELQDEITALKPVPIMGSDGAIRPSFMACCRAAMLECGIPEEKLGVAAQLFYAAWMERECPEDAPSPNSFRLWFDDLDECDKQAAREYNKGLKYPIHLSTDDGTRHGGGAHMMTISNWNETMKTVEDQMGSIGLLDNKKSVAAADCDKLLMEELGIDARKR